MAKNIKKQTFTARRAIIISCFIAAVLLVTGYAAKTWYLDKYLRVADMAETAPTRDLVLLAAKGLKNDAAVDPKTGDLYFPEARLFIPNQIVFGGLTYSVSYDTSTTEVSISSHGAFNRAAVALYTARNIQELYKAVPKLQSCQRGIKLLYAPISDEESANNKLNQTVHLNNGKDLYIYTETSCSELNDIATALRGIQAY